MNEILKIYFLNYKLIHKLGVQNTTKQKQVTMHNEIWGKKNHFIKFVYILFLENINYEYYTDTIGILYMF